MMRVIPIGFVKLQRKARKDPHEWLVSVNTQYLIDKLKIEIGLETLVIVFRGGDHVTRGTWAHPKVVELFEKWQSTPASKLRYRFEAWHREQLAQKYKGETEVETPAGDCDVVTRKYAIEVKDYKHWKSAIGQAQAYAFYLNKKPAIHLINGSPSVRCIEVCAHLGIKIID